MEQKTAPKFEAFSERLGYREEVKQSVLSMSFPKGRVLSGHIARAEPGTSKPHRHLNEAVITVLEGQGYSTIQDVGQTTETRIEWKPGTVFHVPSLALHNHTNTGDKPAVLVAVYAMGPGAEYVYTDILKKKDLKLFQKLGWTDPKTMQELLEKKEPLTESAQRMIREGLGVQ